MLARVNLSQLVDRDDLDHKRIARLLAAMKRHTKPVTPKRLGVIGEEHFRARIEQLDGEMGSFVYNRQLSVEDDIPSVVESAFCYRGEAANKRVIHAGVNWSCAIGNPFRSIGADGIAGLLEKQKSSSGEPIILSLHAAKARVEYKDRGKTEIVS